MLANDKLRIYCDTCDEVWKLVVAVKGVVRASHGNQLRDGLRGFRRVLRCCVVRRYAMLVQQDQKRRRNGHTERRSRKYANNADVYFMRDGAAAALCMTGTR